MLCQKVDIYKGLQSPKNQEKLRNAGLCNYDKSALYLPRQYTGNDLRKCLERLILLDFSAVRQRGKVEFRPFEMCKK